MFIQTKKLEIIGEVSGRGAHEKINPTSELAIVTETNKEAMVQAPVKRDGMNLNEDLKL